MGRARATNFGEEFWLRGEDLNLDLQVMSMMPPIGDLTEARIALVLVLAQEAAANARLRHRVRLPPRRLRTRKVLSGSKLDLTKLLLPADKSRQRPDKAVSRGNPTGTPEEIQKKQF